MALDFQPATSVAYSTNAGHQMGPNWMLKVGPHQVITLSWVVNTRSIALSIQNLEHLDMNETVGTDPMTTVRSMLAIQISKGSSSLFDNYLKRGEIPKITNWVDADLGASFCDQHVRPKVSEASVPLSRSRELHVSGRTVSVPPRGECGSEYVGFRQVGDLGNVNRSGFAT